MWRYLLPGVIVISGFVSVVALDEWLREPRTQSFEPPTVIPAKPPPPTPPPQPEAAPVAPPVVVLPPLPPPIAVAPPAPIVSQPIEPPKPGKTPRPKPTPVVTAKPARPPPEPRALPIEPEQPTVADDVSTARQWLTSGNYSEARQILARIQTRMVLQPVTPDQPDRNDLNAAATMVGIAMRAMDSGDMRRALRTLNDICQMERCQ